MNQERITALESRAKFIESGLKYADHGAYGQDLKELEKIGQEIRSLKPKPVYEVMPARNPFGVGSQHYMHISFSFNDMHAVLVTILEIQGEKLTCRVRSLFGSRVDEIQEIDQAYLKKYGRQA